MPISSKETTLRELQVFPKPMQKPYPQIWQPLTSGRSIKYAAEHGVNGYFNASTNERLKRDMDRYYTAAASRPAGRTASTGASSSTAGTASAGAA